MSLNNPHRLCFWRFPIYTQTSKTRKIKERFFFRFLSSFFLEGRVYQILHMAINLLQEIEKLPGEVYTPKNLSRTIESGKQVHSAFDICKMDYMNLGVTSRKKGIKLKHRLSRDEYSMENITDFFSDDTSSVVSQESRTPAKRQADELSNSLISDGRRQKRKRRSTLMSLPPIESFVEQNKTTQYAIPSTSFFPSNLNAQRDLTNEPYEYADDDNDDNLEVPINYDSYRDSIPNQRHTYDERRVYESNQINDARYGTDLNNTANYEEDAKYEIRPPTPLHRQDAFPLGQQQYNRNERRVQTDYKIDEEEDDNGSFIRLYPTQNNKFRTENDSYSFNLHGFINDTTRDDTNAASIIELESDAEEENMLEEMEQEDEEYKEDESANETNDLAEEDDVSKITNLTLEPIQEDSDEHDSIISGLNDASKDNFSHLDSTRATSFDEAEDSHSSSDGEYLTSQPLKVPESNSGFEGLRRSSRVKVPTLDYWRNERIIYKRSSEKPGLEIEAVIRKDPAKEIDEEDILQRKKEAKKLANKTKYSYNPNRGRPGRPRKNKEPNAEILEKLELGEVETGNWIKFGILESSVKTTTGSLKEEIVAFAPDTAQKEDVEESEQDSYSLATMFDKYKDYVESGMYKLPVKIGKKRIVNSGKTLYNFFVVQGVVEVTLDSNVFLCTQGSSFQIPMCNDYGFENKGDNEVKLFFVQISIPDTIASQFSPGESVKLRDSENSLESSEDQGRVPQRENSEPYRLFVEDSTGRNSFGGLHSSSSKERMAPQSFSEMDIE